MSSSCIQSSCVIGGGGYYLKPTSVFSNRLFVNFATLGSKRSTSLAKSSSVRGRRKNWSSASIKSVLEFDQKHSNDSKLQVSFFFNNFL